MDRPAQFIERYRRWAYEMRDAFQSAQPGDGLPLLVRPVLGAGGTVSRRAAARRERGSDAARAQLPRDPQQHRIEIHAPPGLSPSLPCWKASSAGESRQSFPVRLDGASPTPRPACTSWPSTSRSTAVATASGST